MRPPNLSLIPGGTLDLSEHPWSRLWRHNPINRPWIPTRSWLQHSLESQSLSIEQNCLLPLCTWLTQRPSPPYYIKVLKWPIIGETHIWTIQREVDLVIMMMACIDEEQSLIIETTRSTDEKLWPWCAQSFCIIVVCLWKSVFIDGSSMKYTQNKDIQGHLQWLLSIYETGNGFDGQISSGTSSNSAPWRVFLSKG